MLPYLCKRAEQSLLVVYMAMLRYMAPAHVCKLRFAYYLLAEKACCCQLNQGDAYTVTRRDTVDRNLGSDPCWSREDGYINGPVRGWENSPLSLLLLFSQGPWDHNRLLSNE